MTVKYSWGRLEAHITDLTAAARGSKVRVPRGMAITIRHFRAVVSIPLTQIKARVCCHLSRWEVNEHCPHSQLL